MFKKLGSELIGELIAMFLGEKRLALAIFGIVLGAWSLVEFAAVNRLVGGAVLLLGCLGFFVENVYHSARASVCARGPDR